MNVATRLYHKANKSKNKIYRFFVRQFLSLFFNCDVPFNKNIASTVGFHHNMRGMVISLACSIGENCEIYHHVTIGAGPGGYPKIGNNVLIYTGAVVVGGITVGDGAIITANSCVYHDVPANYVMQGNPAQVRRIRSNLAVGSDPTLQIKKPPVRRTGGFFVRYDRLTILRKKAQNLHSEPRSYTRWIFL